MAKIHKHTALNTVSVKPAVPLARRLPELKGMGLTDFFANYNLLGYDNGDGELACSRVYYDGSQLRTEALRFHETAPVYHVPNILAFHNNQAALVDEHHIGSQSNLFINFKRCPGIVANQRYENSNYTYADLMGHSFGCGMRILTQCNVTFDKNKPTIVLVGRPSSKGWENAEKDYEAILRKFLKKYLPDCHQNITILVLSESLSAMAGALKLQQDKWLNAFIQILDLGSSTFDLTTVTPKGLDPAGEDSFQFGGNQLDRAMTSYGDHLYFKKYPNADGYVLSGDFRKTAALRFKKEICYGDNGSSLGNLALQKQNSYTYYVYRQGKTEPEMDEDTEDPLQLNFPVTANSMNRILNNQIGKDGSEQLPELRCRTERLSGNGLHTTMEHHSWLKACRYVLQQFYDKTKGLYGAGSHLRRRLILTGGVSNMPEVRKLAEEIFGVKAELAENPSQTVSVGLALILGSEILKKALLAQVEETILSDKGPIPNAESLRKEMISASAKKDLDYYEAVIAHWADGSNKKTLAECMNTFADPMNGIFQENDHFLDLSCEAWFRNNAIDRKIEELLVSKFRTMFPVFTKNFHCEITMPDMEGMTPKTLKMSFNNNIYMFYDEHNCPSDPYNDETPLTREQRQTILQVFKSHRDGLKAGASIQYKNGYSVKIDNTSTIPDGIRIQDRAITVSSIEKGYADQLTLSGDAAPIRARILRSLLPQVEEYIQQLTYYLAVSAQS